MKKTIIILSAIIMAACSTEENITSYMDNSPPASRSSITDDSTTNPTLMTDWENVNKIVLYNGNMVDAPWAQGTTLSSTPEFATDIKKEDGWVMLYHTFKALNTYPNANYIALYNRLTGFLKFFYYQESGISNNNGGMWYYQTSSGMPTSLFNLNKYVALPDNASNKYNFVATSNISTTPIDGFRNGWNGFEIEVPYTTDYTNIPFTLSSYNQRVITHEFSGISNSETTGTITRTVEKESGLFKAISNIGGWGAKQIVNKFIKKDTSAVNKGKLGTKILNGIAGLTSGDYTSAISSGLKYIFGNSTVVDTAKVNLTTNTKIKFEGQSTETTTGGPLPSGLVNLHEAAERSIGEDQYLGVWTLSASPEIRLSRYSKVDVIFSIPGTESSVIQEGTLHFPFAEISNLNLSINPSLSPYIKGSVVESEVFIADKIEGQIIPPIFNYVGMGELIYSDSLQTFYELPNLFYKTEELVGYRCVNGYDSFYDWGTSAPKNLYVAVTVELSYEYNGKNKKVLSSRIYKANATMFTDNRILTTGINRKPFIVNTGEFPLENRILMNNYKKIDLKRK
jgi:hypothetical protein